MPPVPPTLANTRPDSEIPSHNTLENEHMKPLTETLLPLSEYRTSPFAPNVPGFNISWWLNGPVMGDGMQCHTFNSGTEEVARAALLPSHPTPADKYPTLKMPPKAVYVAFFEVRDTFRRQGVGRTAIHIISQHYPDELLFTFSANAELFWEGIGWKHHPRIDDSRFHNLTDRKSVV